MLPPPLRQRRALFHLSRAASADNTGGRGRSGQSQHWLQWHSLCTTATGCVTTDGQLRPAAGGQRHQALPQYHPFCGAVGIRWKRWVSSTFKLVSKEEKKSSSGQIGSCENLYFLIAMRTWKKGHTEKSRSEFRMSHSSPSISKWNWTMRDFKNTSGKTKATWSTQTHACTIPFLCSRSAIRIDRTCTQSTKVDGGSMSRQNCFY